MHLLKSKSKNKIFYYGAETVRKGKKTETKMVLKIGEHNQLLSDGINDPEQYALDEIRKINEEKKENKFSITEKYDLNKELEKTENIESKSTTKNLGWLYLNEIYKGLKINDFFYSISGSAKFNFPEIVKYLLTDRIMNPSSKRGSFNNKEKYLGNFSFKLHDIYRALTKISENSDKMQQSLFEATKEIAPLDTDILYYDCTNFYFECEDEDPNELDDNGDIVQWGLRKYGASKEHRPNPIVQMGLFTDANGIPIAYNINHGSNNEQNTVIETEKRMIKNYINSQFIYCSDAGLGCLENRFFNSLEKRKYLVSFSLKNLAKADINSIFKDEFWSVLNPDEKEEDRKSNKNKHISLSEFKKAWTKKYNNEDLTPGETELIKSDIAYKIYPLKRKIKAGDLNQLGFKILSDIEVEETVVVTFSFKYYAYQTNLFEKQLDRANKILENKGSLKSNNPNDVRRFLKETSTTKNGEIADEKTLSIDENKVEKEKRFHGFYAMITNLDYGVNKLIKINSSRRKIEQSFRILKTNFNARPVYVYNPEHIKAHFAICYMALLCYRILENKLNAKSDKPFSSNQIITTLNALNVLEISKQKIYKSCYTNSAILEALEIAYKLGLNKVYYSEKKIKKLEENI